MHNSKTAGYYSIVLAFIAIAMIWFVGHGQAGEASLNAQQMIAVDTVDLNNNDTGVQSGQAGSDQPQTMSHYTRLLATMAYKIHNNYMEPIEPEELAKHAIDGMLDNLDPFSVILEKKSYDDLKKEIIDFKDFTKSDKFRTLSKMEQQKAIDEAFTTNFSKILI